jgi:transposase
LTNEKDAKGFTQKACEHQILCGELAKIASVKKIGKGRSDYFCVEDNSQVHRKKGTRANKGLCNKARVECFIYSIDWPPKSPDLNPIENVWRVIKQKLRNRKPNGGWTLEILRSAVLDIWEHEITPAIYNKWIDELLNRIQAVIDRNGGVTKY